MKEGMERVNLVDFVVKPIHLEVAVPLHVSVSGVLGC